MPRPVNHSAGAEQRAHRILQETSDIEEMRAAQAYLLPLAGLTLAQTALMLGRDRYWVSRTRNRFIRGQMPLQHGGRRHSLVPEDQELKMVKMAIVESGIDAPLIGRRSLRQHLRAVLDRLTKAEVAESTITALLDRVAPKLISGATSTELQQINYWLERVYSAEQALCQKKNIPWP
ncbi:hypothetical protein [Simplicispira suum]|uniref:Uncharacterized protein n=1 Tax=Simplicispira suum TaxID=2109915 RepID=A0A2S0N602_9BURK|nr:hypothetical protein [Simplicispira suum]AVO43568.1 hypothetical protein C6571_19295 [Simplicispira suum]